MALDGAFLYAVRQELSGLIGARIEKIHQPTREEILISLRNLEGSHKILILRFCGSCPCTLDPSEY